MKITKSQLKEIIKELVRETWPGDEELQDEVYVENKMKLTKSKIRKYNNIASKNKKPVMVRVGHVWYTWLEGANGSVFLTTKSGRDIEFNYNQIDDIRESITKISKTKLREMIGEEIEQLNELPMAPFSSKEAKLHVSADIKDMSKILGKSSHQIIKIMMNGVKNGKYDAMDISRGIKEGPAGRTHYGEMDFIQELWHKVRDGFRRYSKNKKLRR